MLIISIAFNLAILYKYTLRVYDRFYKKKSIVDKINEIIIMLLNYPYYLLINSIKLSLGNCCLLRIINRRKARIILRPPMFCVKRTNLYYFKITIMPIVCFVSVPNSIALSLYIYC
jgi:hypothetical protein